MTVAGFGGGAAAVRGSDDSKQDDVIECGFMQELLACSSDCGEG